MSDGRKTPQISNGGEVLWASYPPYPPDPNYFQLPNYPPQTPEEQQQMWEHYNMMCAYVAGMSQNYAYPPYAYPQYLYTPPPQSMQYASDSDECGYSSTDEMNYYGAYFKKYPPPIQPYRGYYQEQRAQTPHIVITPSNVSGNSHHVGANKEHKNVENLSPSVNGDSESTADDGSDTEVEEDSDRPQGLQTIKSVPDISIYKDSSTSDILSQNSETDADDVDEDEVNEGGQVEFEEESCLPHQLSVIYEESDFSESESYKKVKRKEDLETASEGESSTATLDNVEDTDDDIIDSDNALVHVRLPLKLQFTKTENNEEVTTVTVGNSEIQSSPEVEIKHEELIVTDIIKDGPDPEVSVTLKIPKKKPVVTDKTVSHSIDIEEGKLGLNKNKECQSIKTGENDFENDCDKEISIAVSDSDTCNEKNQRGVSESPVDFWKVLSSDDIPAKASAPADVSINVTLTSKSLTSKSPNSNLTSESEESKPEESDCHWEDDSSSTSVQTVRIGQFSGSDQFSGSEVEASATADEVEDLHKVPFESESIANEMSNENIQEIEKKCEREEQERIPIEELLYDEISSSDDDDDDESISSTSSSSSSEENSEPSEEVKESLSVESSKAGSKTDDDVFSSEISKSEDNNLLSVEEKCRKVSANSCKSQDESEEDDSGVTSDMSRHISETDTDPECGSELRKLTPYQRAATHSRLFKLLQEECGQEDDEEEKEEKKPIDAESLTSRKERLTLPLHTSINSDPDSMSSSSGINSPASPTVSDRLVKELVHSLLHKRKGRHFRKLPMEKLYAAAYRILQEDMDPYDTVSSTSDESFRHSPINETTANQTNNNTAITTPSQQDVFGANYYDYCDYYNTWGNPYYYSNVEESLGYDIVPSRAFKILQERAQTPHGFSSGIVEGLTAKCPRVLSSKDIPRDNNVQTPDSNPHASSSSET